MKGPGIGRQRRRHLPTPGRLRARFATSFGLGLATCVVVLTTSACGSAGPSAGSAAVPGNPSVPIPSVQGPVEPASHISLLGSTTFALAPLGYEQNEYFLSGTATSYSSKKPLAKDGRWSVSTSTRATYKTRIVVYRPIDPKRFDGTVVVEWLNVTGGVDAAAAWLQSHIQMIRDGMVYVGVDAQAGGINGESGSLASGAEPGGGGLKGIDPGRYGTLHHPGDSYSYSIFEQAGKAVRHDAVKILGGLEPKRVLALGESQSAFRLTSYIDALQKRSSGIYDGYFVYSRGGNAAALSESPQQTVNPPTPTYIRTDLHVPVFLFETETDLVGLGYVAARQPPTGEIREWEVAGSAHDDSYGLLYSRADTGNGTADAAAFQSMLTPSADPIPGIVSCTKPINAGSHTYELRAAIQAVNRWMETGQPPPQSPRLDVAHGRTHFVTNSLGEAEGGIRTPQVAAPVATLSGLGQPGLQGSGQPRPTTTTLGAGQICAIFGTTFPFDAAKLASLYPSHTAFVEKWDSATAALVKSGYLLPADARTLDAVARRSHVGQ